MDRKITRGKPPATSLSDAVWIGRALSQSSEQAWLPKPPLRDHSKDPHLRTSLRAELAYEVIINHGMIISCPGRVRDMSMSGAFVEMDVGDLQEGVAVEFVLRCYYKGERVELRISALATRLQEDGVALNFGRYDDDTYTQLINLLYAR
ncbi:MAG: PilZ domain-containing protein [Acidiferrobacterales bacterium]